MQIKILKISRGRSRSPKFADISHFTLLLGEQRQWNAQRILYHNQINARALIGPSAMIYCAGKPWKFRMSSELLYKSNRPQVFMVYRPAARDLGIL